MACIYSDSYSLLAYKVGSKARISRRFVKVGDKKIATKIIKVPVNKNDVLANVKQKSYFY